jgi:pimeloyl-ACP methyl ester carboxylesterase
MPLKPRAILSRIAVALALIVVLGVVAFFVDPFFFKQKGETLYLRHNGVASRYVRVDGYRIHYFEAIPPAGAPERPLLLVHGLGASAGDWTTMLPGLAHAGYHVYAPDLLGYGNSDKPKDSTYSLGQEQSIVQHFATNVGLTHFDLGGWSMGGWLALKITLDQPASVRRLILFDSAGIYFPLDFPMDLFTPTDNAGIERLVDMIEPNKHFIHIPNWAYPALLRRYRENGWITSRSFADMITGRELLDFRLNRIQQPTLILWGTEDKLIPYETARRMHGLIRNSTLVGIPGCGHLAPAECSTQVLPETIRFLNERVPPDPTERILPLQPQSNPPDKPRPKGEPPTQ